MRRAIRWTDGRLPSTLPSARRRKLLEIVGLLGRDNDGTALKSGRQTGGWQRVRRSMSLKVPSLADTAVAAEGYHPLESCYRNRLPRSC